MTINKTPWRNGSASDSRSEGCVFESRRAHLFGCSLAPFFGLRGHRGKKKASLGGLEPPTFRLTAERANRLRHRDLVKICLFNLNQFFIGLFYLPQDHLRVKLWVAWPSGLRRWFKAPVSSEAWVRIPPLPRLFRLNY